jgi:Rne/Rng family ribonuclease
MAKEICISSTPHETRLAILEDDQLAEIYYERENEYTLAGSVYKGRVTRVLPGMQSAFVDIGLERDAFLYVTDFLEMEDQEDTDEVERAASQGDTVRHPLAQSGQAQVQPQVLGQGQPQPAPGAPRQGRNEGNGRERGRRGESRQPAADGESQRQLPATPTLSVTPVSSLAAPSESASPVIPASVADATAQQDETDEQGARRWRGRRRRRGGRGRDDAGQLGASADSAAGAESEEAEGHAFEDAPPLEFEAAASQQAGRSSSALPAQPAAAFAVEPRSAAPAPFLLPGESLGKYGATVTKSAPSRLILSELPPDTSDPLPDRTVAKPSTLIENEIVWDGKGLLPGESIARHRQQEPPAATVPSATVDAEPSGVFVRTAKVDSDSEETLQREEATIEPAPFEFSEEFAEFSPQHPIETDKTDGPVEVYEEFEEEELPHGELAPEDVEEAVHAEAKPALVEHGADVYEEEVHENWTEHSTEQNPEPHDAEHHDAEHEEPQDASASHNVDPLPPSSFRLKDLFGGRKKEEEPAPIAPAPAAATKTVPAVSAYSPGAGLVEEEIIEEEEYEFTPLKAHHSDDHDLEDLEEETLQQQIRSGALGEMLQGARLDSRLLIDSEDDEDSDEEDVEGSPASAGDRGRSATAPSGGRDRGGDRGGRGRRGRNESGGASGASGSGDGRRGPSSQSRRSAQLSNLPIISDLLKPGQEILVQIAKEPIAKKGARITSHIALPGRFLVFMPTVSHVGVSRKIASDEERQRLKRILVSEKGDASGGFIVRTAAEGATEEELRADLRFLINLWADIKQRADTSKPPALIYHDLNLIERILRDQVSDNFSHIWVDSEADYERIVRFLNRFSPELVRRVKLYTKEVPLFEHFGIQDEISKALRSKVWLKSGGSIVINQTEALVAIDINTGKYVGKTARLEDTILRTNLDSIPEIVRQIRLRDLGGIIVIDFIDMDERKNRTRVMAALEEALKQDRAPTKVLQFNDFGLVAITRKRVKQSLERTLSVPCPVCQATGMVKSAATVSNEIYIEMRKMRKHFDQSEVLLRVHPETAKALKANNARWLVELEDLAGKNVLVKSDATLHPEQFDIQG